MDTSDVKFRSVQWICTEVLLAFAALWNLLPRESRLRRQPSQALIEADPISTLFQVDLHVLDRICPHRLHSQPRLAADRCGKDHRVPHSRGSVHEHI